MASDALPPLTLLDSEAIQGQLKGLAKSGELALLVRSREAYAQVLTLHEAAIKQAIEQAANQVLDAATDWELLDFNRFAPEHRVLSPTESLQLAPLSDYLKGVYPQHSIAYCLEASLEGLDDQEMKEFLSKVFALRSSHPNVGTQAVRTENKVYVIFFFKPGQA